MVTEDLNQELYEEIIIKQHMFSFEVILKAAYLLLNKLYFVFDEIEHNDIKVMIRPKVEMDAIMFKNLISEFNNELVNYSVYLSESVRTQATRTIIMEKFLTGGARGDEIKNIISESRKLDSVSQSQDSSISDGLDDNSLSVDDSSISGLPEDEDPYEISKLWDEAENSIYDEPVNPNISENSVEDSLAEAERISPKSNLDSAEEISRLWDEAEKSIDDSIDDDFDETELNFDSSSRIN